MADGSRARFAGPPEAVVDILVKHMDVPNFLGYAEDMSGPKQPAKLLRKRCLFVELKGVASKLNFTQKFLQEALQLAYEQCVVKQWKRKMTDEQQMVWKLSLAKQLRVACRHIMQSQKTVWYKKLIGEYSEYSHKANCQNVSDVGSARCWKHVWHVGRMCRALWFKLLPPPPRPADFYSEGGQLKPNVHDHGSGVAPGLLLGSSRE